jgi:hypothetical protein
MKSYWFLCVTFIASQGTRNMGEAHGNLALRITDQYFNPTAALNLIQYEVRSLLPHIPADELHLRLIVNNVQQISR